MRGTGWLTLICLISLGGLFALKSNIGARPLFGEAAAIPALSPDLMIEDRPPLAKSDRLPSPYFDKPATKPAGAVKLVPNEADPAITPKANLAGEVTPPPVTKSGAGELTTWHWHVGSRITKRTTVVPPQ